MTTQINLKWSAPVEDGNTPITGYKIEVKRDANSYTTLVVDTKSTTKTYTHSNLITNSKYTYKISAINLISTSDASNEFSATPKSTNIQISPLGKLNIDEGKLLLFTVKLLDNSVSNVVFSLDKNPPAGAKIISNTGVFSWTPASSDGGKTYTIDIVAKKDGIEDRETVTITVKDVMTSSQPTEPKELGLASFVDESQDPQSYVDRYNNESTYKEWFDANFADYDSIYQAVGLEEPLLIPASFVDETKDPQSYVDRYNNEATYKEWFDANFADYDSIYQAVGLEEPKVVEEEFGECGEGTDLVNGMCMIIDNLEGGGCLIATATYGSEMAPQVQLLREIRDNQLMDTESGVSFMSGFNQLYYSFSPHIADMERESPAFKELVKIGITPLLSTLSIMSHAETESEVFVYGIGVMLMNLGMYVAIPAIVIFKTRKYIKI